MVSLRRLLAAAAVLALMLSQMRPATARRIAHENAGRLFAARRAP